MARPAPRVLASRGRHGFERGRRLRHPPLLRLRNRRLRLCCGHEASETLDAPFVSPWEDPRAWNAAPDSTILILGTGLTMVDAAIALSESGHRGPIVALSRRGLLPQ